MSRELLAASSSVITSMTFPRILIFSLAFFAASAEIQITPIKCCDNETNLLVENKCVPLAGGKSLPVNLKCPDKYVLDPQTFPDSDGFNIAPDGSLNASDFKIPVPPEE